MKSRLIVTIAIGLAIAIGSVYPNQSRAVAALKAEDDFQLVKVADGVYAAIAKPGGLASGNAGFVIGDEGVLIFDTFFTPAAVEELIGEIQTLTKLPIKYAVNSLSASAKFYCSPCRDTREGTSSPMCPTRMSCSPVISAGQRRCPIWLTQP